MPSGPSSPDAPRSFARAAALAVLLACQSGDRPLDDEIEKRAAEFRLDSRDRALTMELVYGVLRRLETIDWRLAPVLNKPLPRLPAVVQTLLRLGAYQLLFMDRIPASAAVNESVQLAKSSTMTPSRDWSGFVNAVLRNLIRVPEPAPPDPAIDPAQALSIRHAVPRWLCQRWIDRLGFDQAESACLAASRIPAVTLRVNGLRLTREALLDRFHRDGIPARATVISPVGVILEKGQLVTALPGFQDGDFYVEDEAAQLIPLLLNPQPGDFVLDACAAPGGKTTHLAELMNNEGHILALDRRRTRLDLLRENCRRLGLTIVTEVVADARKPSDALTRFHKGSGQPGRSTTPPIRLVDRILLDAPCSGLGVLRRHPEAKWRKQPAVISRHQHVQKEILNAVAAVLRPGGVLVYSTCSTEPEETEDVIAQFCGVHPNWTRESAASWLPSSALTYVTANGAVSTLGNDCGMDGFYAVRLRKVS
jgi:16S rRNA (cytosine967-C5)-methyltransferase